MEEGDELVVAPDDEGRLVVAGQDWRELPLPPDVGAITLLDASQNQLISLPPSMENLTCLVELDVSKNQLSALAPELGNCKQLRVLRASCNYIRSFPAELCACTLLEELALDKNKISELPAALGGLSALRILLLQENDLRALPAAVGDLTGLMEINVEGNPRLAMVPEPLRSDTELILWLCKLHGDHAREIRLVEELNARMEARQVQAEETKLRLREEIRALEVEKTRLLKRLRSFPSSRRLQQAASGCVTS